jgi:glycosyltransferase involved in cell wall biosynthesis
MHILIAALHRPDKPTGVCRHAVNLARCLAITETVSRVTLVIGRWQKQYFESSFTIDSAKIELVDIDIPNNSIARNTWFLFGLPKLVREIRPTIVHLSFPLPFLRSRFSCPIVATIHDFYPYECPENFGRLRAFFNCSFLKQCVLDSDGLSCVSQLTLDRLKTFFPKAALQKTLAAVYNYVDFEGVSAKIPDAIAANADVPFLLCVAQHRKNKNLDLLVKSYSSLLRDRNLDSATKLIIVGSSGPETENLRNLIETNNLQKRVLLLSSVEDTELCWLYQHCSLFVIPSSTEGFCIPLVEALNFSCKVVCSDILIFREIARSNCHYFDLTDEAIEHLAQAIIRSLNLPVSNDNSQDCRFLKATIAEQYLEFYDKVLKNSRYVFALPTN